MDSSEKTNDFTNCSQTSKTVPVTKPVSVGQSCSSLVSMRFNNNLQRTIYENSVKQKEQSIDINLPEGEKWCEKCKLHGILKQAAKNRGYCTSCNRNRCVFPSCKYNCETDLFTCQQHTTTFLCKQTWQIDPNTTMACNAYVYHGKSQLCGTCYAKFLAYQQTLILESYEKQRMEQANMFKKSFSDNHEAMEAFKQWNKEFTDNFVNELEKTDEDISDEE